MFSKRERPETDDFVIKKYLVGKDKYFVEISLLQEISKKYKFQVFQEIAIALPTK